jgi:hypothetical protein
MTLKKLHKNRNLYSVLGNSKPRLREAVLEHGIDSKILNLLSEHCLYLTEGNVQWPEGVGQQTKQHRSHVLALV